MRLNSIGARIAAWYACAATATLACLFVAGYQFLQSHLLHGLDLMNEAEFHQIEAHLGPDYATLSSPFMELRIRDVADFAYALFYVEIHVPKKGVYFRSSNLNGHSIPDVHDQQRYIVNIADVGDVRAAEFKLTPFEITVATPLKPVREIMSSYVHVAAGLLALMLLVSLAIGFGLSRVMLHPIRVIRDTANRIRSDNLSERIPIANVRDEISDLATLLNQMFDRLEISFGQIRRFTADASHELKTPLSLIRLHAERLLSGSELTPPQREALHVQLEEVAHLNRIIEELLLLSRVDANAIELKLSVQEPTGFLQGLAQDATALAEHHGMVFNLRVDQPGQAAFEQKWMRQVLLNLITNAIHVSAPGGRITLRSGFEEGLWRLCVEDHGPGLSEEHRESMFERFVRVGTPGVEYQGSGLGLAICRSIVGLHGGRIFATSAIGHAGLRVVIELPEAS